MTGAALLVFVFMWGAIDLTYTCCCILRAASRAVWERFA